MKMMKMTTKTYRLRVLMSLKMARFTQVSGKMGTGTDTENNTGMMEAFMKVIGEKVCIYI